MTWHPPKRPAEDEYYYFDFKKVLPAGVTILNAEWGVSVLKGNDASPEDMLMGDPIVSGSKVYHMLTAGVPGVKYEFWCRAQLSDGQTLEEREELRVTA